MDESKKEGINPIEPLGKDESEPSPAQGITRYPGYKYPRIGRRTVQFPIVHPDAGRPGNSKLVQFPKGSVGKLPGGAA